MSIELETLGGNEQEVRGALEEHTDRLATDYCRLSDKQGDVLSDVLAAFTEGALSQELGAELFAKFLELNGEQRIAEEKLAMLYDFFGTPVEKRVF